MILPPKEMIEYVRKLEDRCRKYEWIVKEQMNLIHDLKAGKAESAEMLKALMEIETKRKGM